jgi:hypothetical protein
MRPVNTRLANLHWNIARILAVVGVMSAAPLSRADDAGQKIVDETRLSLRQQGFKTDLSDFNLSTSPELRAREAVLKATGPNLRSELFANPNSPNLMEAVGTNSAVVVWKLDSLKNQYRSRPDRGDELTWEEFREAINANQPQVDDACDAILSGPIRFNLNASPGNAMLLPHLAMLRDLTQAFGRRTVLDLHDGDLDAAWTNLMAATRLVTAWEPEPVEISQLVRFANTSLAFNAIWQALQTNGWPDGQLARLQTEWESVDFFTHLPETAAFKRASDAALCQQDRQGGLSPLPSFIQFVQAAWQSPSLIWSLLKQRRDQMNYLEHGSYEDEKALLLFHRDRELELRKAVQAPTWSAMRQLPGVVNIPAFQSKYRSRMQSMLHLHQMHLQFQNEGPSLLGRAATAEAQRRLIVAAIALERYRGKHGSYPNSLSELAPEFLKKPPADFMDGQPLRYRPAADGHFFLYSVGLDCVDHGGQMPSRERRGGANFGPDRFGALSKADIVWPLPASTAAVEAVRAEEAEAQAERAGKAEEMAAAAQWDHTARHQADVEKILAAPAAPNPPDVDYHGRHLSEVLRNRAASGTNQLTLGEMLTLKQIITGAEPETVTFEMPVSYDVVTKLGRLFLFIDPANNDDSDEGCNVQQMECDRAHNGDCLLVWSTIFESFGKHALQAGLLVNELPPNSRDIIGPLLPFTITNLCQFSLSSAYFDPRTGATLHAKLPERNGHYTIELNTTNGALIKTLNGSTSNGVIKVHWDLMDDQGRRFTNDFFNSVFHITLPDSGRSQTLKGP